jgi:DNA-binding NarL/FixJ family response regulator
MRLAAEPDMEVAGFAADGLDALLLVDKLAPDVILMDVEMPRQDGIETCRLLHQTHPGTPVVLLSIHDDAQTQRRAMQTKAASFVSKQNPAECLLAAIREAARRSANGATGTGLN